MRNVTDHLSRTLLISPNPKRIVSLVPSQTELLAFLGCDEEVVGITKFCVHPSGWLKSKMRIGGTKNPNIERIKLLKPDLVIANKEENRKEDVIAISKFAPVWVSNIEDLTSAYQMISDIGYLCNKEKMAQELVYAIKFAWNELPCFHQKSVLYAIWKDPYMFAGKNTFINHILNKMGLTNFATDFDNRYPTLTLETIAGLKPDFLFLSSEPYPFTHKHLATFESILPKTHITIVDGEYFSWYGSRLLEAAHYLKDLTTTLQQIQTNT